MSVEKYFKEDHIITKQFFRKEEIGFGDYVPNEKENCSPCDNCVQVEACKEEKLACAAYYYYLSSWGNKSYENKGKTRYPTKFFYAMCFPEGFSRRLRDPKKDFDKEYLRSFVGLIRGKTVRGLRKKYGINSCIFREIRRIKVEK